MSEKILAFKAATAALSKDTGLDEAKEILRAAKLLLLDLTLTEEEDAFADLKERCPLAPDWLKLYRREVKENRRRTRSNGRAGNDEATPTALLPGLVDLVEHEGAPAFLMLTEDGVGIAPQWEHDGVSYVPPPEEKIPWLLPRSAEVLKWYSLKEPPGVLYDDLLAYHQWISELPSDGYYDLITAWDFHTYLLEPAQYSPELCLFAVPERGKTRTGQGMIYVARRGIHVESLRDAYLVRIAHNCQATILFDCMNLWKKAEGAGSEDIILGRFERGIKVPRVIYPERGAHRDTVYYDIFGPTIIATNIAVHNILDSRGVQINMPQTVRRYEEDITPEVALPLKERLTAWRAHHLGKALPECAKPAAGRLGDILKPLLQIIRLVKPERESVFMALVREIGRGRLLDRADSLEGQILKVVWSLRGEVQRGILPVKRITDALNEDLTEREKLTYHKVGRRLWALGLDRGDTGNNTAALVWNEKKIVQISCAYGVKEIPEIPEGQAESSFPDGCFAGVSDISQKRQEKHPSAKPHESYVSGVSGILGISPKVREGEKTISPLEAGRDLWEGEA
jgi:hypothetical protein